MAGPSCLPSPGTSSSRLRTHAKLRVGDMRVRSGFEVEREAKAINCVASVLQADGDTFYGDLARDRIATLKQADAQGLLNRQQEGRRLAPVALEYRDASRARELATRLGLRGSPSGCRLLLREKGQLGADIGVERGREWRDQPNLAYHFPGPELGRLQHTCTSAAPPALRSPSARRKGRARRVRGQAHHTGSRRCARPRAVHGMRSATASR